MRRWKDIVDMHALLCVIRTLSVVEDKGFGNRPLPREATVPEPGASCVGCHGRYNDDKFRFPLRW